MNGIVEYTDFLFKELDTYEEEPIQRECGREGAVARMELLIHVFEGLADWRHDGVKAAFEKTVEETGASLGAFVHPTRLALTGKSVGPELFELAVLLGKETRMARMRRAAEYIKGLQQ